MGEFETVLRERVAEAEESCRVARAGDAEVWQQAADALADLLKIATEHGVDVGVVSNAAAEDAGGG